MKLVLDALLFLLASGAARFVASLGDGRSWSALDAVVAMLAIHLFFPTLTIGTVAARAVVLFELMRTSRLNRRTYGLVSFATMMLSLAGTGFLRADNAALARFAVAGVFCVILAFSSPLPFSVEGIAGPERDST